MGFQTVAFLCGHQVKVNPGNPAYRNPRQEEHLKILRVNSTYLKEKFLGDAVIQW